MKDQLKKSNRSTLPPTPKCICLPELGAGGSPSDLPGGQTTDPSSQGRAPASPFQLPAGVREQPTVGIYGPTFFDSSVPEVLPSLWVSRCLERLGWLGSVEWNLTWTRRDTGQRRSIYRLRPSGPRISGTGCTGWPTPAERDHRYPNRLPYQDRGGGQKGEQLANMVTQVVGWPTPMSAPESEASHGQHSGQWRKAMSEAMAGWSTPRSTDGEKGGPGMTFGAGGTPLPAQAAQLVGWCTPTTPSGGQRNPEGTTLEGRRPDGSKATVTLKDQAEVLGTTTASSAPTPKDATGASGALSPAFVSYLMGFPAEWLEYAPLTSPSSKKASRRGSKS